MKEPFEQQEMLEFMGALRAQEIASMKGEDHEIIPVGFCLAKACERLRVWIGSEGELRVKLVARNIDCLDRGEGARHGVGAVIFALSIDGVYFTTVGIKTLGQIDEMARKLMHGAENSDLLGPAKYSWKSEEEAWEGALRFHVAESQEQRVLQTVGYHVSLMQARVIDAQMGGASVNTPRGPRL